MHIGESEAEVTDFFLYLTCFISQFASWRTVLDGPLDRRGVMHEAWCNATALSSRDADKGAMQNNMMADTLHLTTKFLSRVSILTSDIDIGIMSVRP